MNKHKIGLRIVLIILILVLVLIAVYSGLKITTSFVTPKTDVPEDTVASKTITRDGVEYFPRQDITVFMLMGIDRLGPVQASSSYTNTGEADMVALAVFDETAKTYRILLLNRDTMLEMPILGIGGMNAGTAYGQLALAHTYGSGLKDSCENTRTAVSDLLYGIDIDYYMSMNMDAISLLTDAVGGVKVTVADDFSAVDPTIPMGEALLSGAQAFNFVQNRKDVGNEMNVSRMDRQKEYMNGFLNALNTKLEESDAFVLETYNSMAQYLVSNCSVNNLSTMINRYSDYTFKGVTSPEGNNIKGEKFMEFHIDETALDDLVIELFYSEKNI